MARAQAQIRLVFPSMTEMSTDDLKGMTIFYGLGSPAIKKIDIAEGIQEHLFPDLMEAKKNAEAEKKAEAKAKKTAKAKPTPLPVQTPAKAKPTPLPVQTPTEPQTFNIDTPKAEESDEEKAEEFKFFVEVKCDGEAEWYGLVKDATVLDLKKKIHDKKDIPADHQRLLSKAGKLLNTDATISSIVADSDEKETSRLHMILELDGGGKILILSWKSCSINLLFFM